MSPVLIIALAIMVIYGIYYVSPEPKLGNSEPIEALSYGFATGYQTMDLFAAFFFSTLVYKQMSEIMPANATDRVLIRFSIKPSILGSLFLAIIYLGLVYLGAHYKAVIDPAKPQLMLPSIANYVLGKYSTILIAIVMILSCFTTAVALGNIYARYLCTLFKFKEFYFPYILALTCLISFAISLLNFRGIASFLAPVLECTYPGIILLTIVSILTGKFKRVKLLLFWIVTVAMILTKLIF